MLHINSERLLHEIEELGHIGQQESGGVDRRPFSPAERAARTFFADRARAAGLAVQVDGAANLSARLECGPAGARTILTGSHLDTVPNGGNFDGALGVLAGLEVLRTVAEAGMSLPVHLEAIAFTDEEGRLGGLTTGSRALVGSVASDEFARILQQAAAYPDDLAAMQQEVPGGLTVDSMLAAKRNVNEIAAFIELHVEQGPRLEHAGATIGVISAIVGRRAYEVNFSGRSDHAGTTPMELRADALVAAARFITQATDAAQRTFPNCVLTCGGIEVGPGVYNVIPNRAQVMLEFRATDEATIAVLDSMVRRAAADAARQTGVEHTLTPTAKLAPYSLDNNIQLAIRIACDMLHLRYLTFPSGAVHDAHSLAPYVPTGLIFVPSVGGRSHTPEEMTLPDDVVAGANTLLHTMLIMAERVGVKVS